MVKTPVNHNFMNYKNIVFAGLDAKQSVALIISAIAALIEWCFLRLLLEVKNDSVITVCIVATVSVVVGVVSYEKDGQNIFEIVKGGKLIKGKENLCNESTETFEKYRYTETIIKEEMDDSQFDAMVKKMIAAFIGVCVLIVGIIVALICIL